MQPEGGSGMCIITHIMRYVMGVLTPVDRILLLGFCTGAITALVLAGITGFERKTTP